jgi:uncharacterized OB-fold protein
LSASTETAAHSAPFSKGVPAGRLLLQRCSRCGCVPNYPRIACPSCFETLEWFEATGGGTISTYSILQRTHSDRYAEHLPIVLVRVELEEGGELISTLVGADRLDAEIGAAVQFAGSEGWSTLPQFRLARDMTKRRVTA